MRPERDGDGADALCGGQLAGSPREPAMAGMHPVEDAKRQRRRPHRRERPKIVVDAHILFFSVPALSPGSLPRLGPPRNSLGLGGARQAGVHWTALRAARRWS